MTIVDTRDTIERSPSLLRRLWPALDATSLVIVLAWAYVVLPRLVQSAVAAKHRATVGDPVPESPLAAQTELALTAALALCCGLVLLTRSVRQLPTTRRTALLALLAPWVFLVVRDIYLDRLPGAGALLFPMLVITLWALQPSVERLALLGWLVGATAALAMLMGYYVPHRGIYISAGGDYVDPDKQLLPIGILIGPFTDGNNLAQFLVIGVAAICFVRRPGWRLLLAALTASALIWTSSRSSLLALVVGLVTVGGLLVAQPRFRPTWTVLGVGATALAVAAPPLFTTDPAAFTNRGAIWQASLHAWQSQPLIGLGSRWYSEVGDYAAGLGGFAFHGHNQFVQTLVYGGLVYLLLTTGLLGAVTAAAARLSASVSILPAAYLVVLLVSCTQEVSFGVVDRGFLLCVTVLPIAVITFAPQPPPGSESSADHRARGRSRSRPR